MCWILFCWMVVSLMFARTCWLQVPRRTLYSIIRDMCDCRVSRIRPTLRMPLVCMRISPIRLDLLSTAFCVLDKSPHRESWTWALSLSFATKICNKIYFLITFLVYVQYVQKKHPMYSSMKEDTVWSFERLQAYIDEKYAKEKELPENWVFTTFTVSFCIPTLLLLFFFGFREGTRHGLLQRVRICSQSLCSEHFPLLAREP